MTTYIYETVPDSPDFPIRRFEVKQSMNDAPLTLDPETGQRVRRVISGGMGVIVAGARSTDSVRHLALFVVPAVAVVAKKDVYPRRSARAFSRSGETVRPHALAGIA